MTQQFFLDLDRTLFRTERWQLIADEVSKRFLGEESGQKLLAQQKKYQIYPDKDHPTRYYHDFIQQLIDNGLDPEVVFETLTHSSLADGRFEYEGTAAFITWLQQYGTTTILTYGNDRYQRFKVALCPSLKDIPIITTLGEKSKYLSSTTGGTWMIDDKFVEGLSSNTHFIRIDHTRVLPRKEPYPVCYSFEEIEEVIYHEMH